MGRPRKLAQATEINITVLDVKPIRSLAPMFPSPLGSHTITPPTNPSLCVTPFGAPNAESGANPPGFTPGQMPPPMFFMGASGAPAPQDVKSPESKMETPTVSTGEVKKRRGRPRKNELSTGPGTTRGRGRGRGRGRPRGARSSQ